MSTKDSNLALALGIPGFLMQGAVVFMPDSDNMAAIATVLIFAFVGFALYMTAFGLFARAKGHSGAYALLAFLGLIGLIILLVIEDRHPERQRMRTRRRTTYNSNEDALADLDRM